MSKLRIHVHTADAMRQNSFVASVVCIGHKGTGLVLAYMVLTYCTGNHFSGLTLMVGPRTLLTQDLRLIWHR